MCIYPFACTFLCEPTILLEISSQTLELFAFKLGEALSVSFHCHTVYLKTELFKKYNTELGHQFM